jgi:hypothetical protein
VFEEQFNRNGGTCAFTAILEFNTDAICQASGQNKKDAKISCAKNAVGIVAPNVFKARWPNDSLPEVDAEDTEVDIDSSTLTIGDDRLLKMQHLFKPYTPYSLLKQAYCMALHQNKRFTLEETQK